MNGRRLRRAHQLALLVFLAGLLVFQLAQRPEEAKPRAVHASESEPIAAAPPIAPLVDFESWRARYEASPPRQKSALVPQGIALAEARRDAFLELMRHDPAAALQRALPLAELAVLPEELVPYFEQPISGLGSIDLQWQTSLREDKSLACQHQNVLYLAGNSWELVTPRAEGPRSPRKDIAVSGIALGPLAVLAPSPVRALTPGERESAAQRYPVGNPDRLDPVTGGPASTGSSALIAGEVFDFESQVVIEHVAGMLVAAEDEAFAQDRYQVNYPLEWLGAGDDRTSGDETPVAATPFMDDMIDALIIRVDFSDFPGEPVSQGGLETTLTSVKSNVEEFSYNAATINSTVSPIVYRLPQAGESYATSGNNDQLHSDARNLASADYTLSDYDVIAVFFPDLGDVEDSKITYAGLATIGGSNHWINGANDVRVILHEFGHNYGLHHANYWDPSEMLEGDYDVPSSREYGDIFDVMGSGLAPEGHFNPYHKNRLEWLPDSKVTTAMADGTIRIYRFDDAGALANPTLAVKVPLGNGAAYWIGYRQLYTSASYNLATGAYVIAEGLSESGESNLIDATPGSQSPESDDRTDCGLEMGTPFSDSGVTLTAVARGGTSPNEWIDVSVAFTSRIGLAATNLDVDEQAGAVWLTVKRQFGSAGAASVDFASSDGTATASADYYSVAGTVTWADGDATDKRVAIPIRPDALAEGIEGFTVTLSNPAGASLDALASAATISIMDPGSRSATFTPSFFNNAVYDIELLPDGKVLAGGRIQDGGGDLSSVRHLVRFNRDGSADSSLATGTGFDERVRAVAVQADGKILAGGDFTSYNGTPCAGLIRLDPDGSIDTNIGGVDNGTVNIIALEIDGSILAGGSFTSFAGSAAEGLVRLTSAGVPDGDNALTLPFGTAFFQPIVYDLIAEPGGEIVAAGSFYLAGSSPARPGIVRLNNDGTRDTSFDPGTGPHLAGDDSQVRTVYDVAALPNGQYVIGGAFTAYNETPIDYLARIDSDGSLDPTFSPPSLSDPVRSLAVQPDGKVIAGLLGGGSSLSRLLPTGTSDPTFVVGTGPAGTVYSLALEESGMLYIGGNYFQFDGAIARPITRIATGTDPYDYWALANFSAAQIANGDADPDADPDGDGSRNAGERALGTDPNIANADHAFGPGGAGSIGLHETASGERYLEATVTKGADSSGAWFMARFTDSPLEPYLPNPPAPGANSVYEIIEDSPTTFTVRDRTPLGDGSRFVKIGIMPPE